MGSWPERVGLWGKDGIAAYLEELEARGVSAQAALIAIRSCDAGQAFPPSAPELAGLVQRDPSRPTATEAIEQIYGPGGVFGFKRANVTVSPWVLAFVDRYGPDRLRLLEVDDDEYGALRRKELGQAYEEFLVAMEGRELHEIATGRRRQLGRFDPLASLGLQPPAQIEPLADDDEDTQR
jgi:hypothetical protein